MVIYILFMIQIVLYFTIMIIILSEPDVSLPYQYAKEEQNDKNVRRSRVQREINKKRRLSNCEKQVFTNDLSLGKGYTYYNL